MHSYNFHIQISIINTFLFVNWEKAIQVLLAIWNINPDINFLKK